MQGRGLKPVIVSRHRGAVDVAPYAGAWIETLQSSLGVYSLASPLMQGRGLKPADPPNPEDPVGRPLCRGVD